MQLLTKILTNKTTLTHFVQLPARPSSTIIMPQLNLTDSWKGFSLDDKCIFPKIISTNNHWNHKHVHSISVRGFFNLCFKKTSVYNLKLLMNIKIHTQCSNHMYIGYLKVICSLMSKNEIFFSLSRSNIYYINYFSCTNRKPHQSQNVDAMASLSKFGKVMRFIFN